MLKYVTQYHGIKFLHQFDRTASAKLLNCAMEKFINSIKVFCISQKRFYCVHICAMTTQRLAKISIATSHFENPWP